MVVLDPDATATHHMRAESAPTADALVSRYLPLVGHLVAEYQSSVSPRVRAEDLRCAGLAALVRAATGFDSTGPASFRSHAEPVIRAALLDQVRAGGRDAGRTAPAVTRSPDPAGSVSVQADLATALGRPPTGEDLAAFVVDVDGPPTGGDRADYLHAAMSDLPEPQRTVVEMYFLNGASLAEIARRLQVRESEVAQWRGDALRALRSAMTEPAPAAGSTASRAGNGPAGGRAAAYAERALLTQVAALRAGRQSSTPAVARRVS